MRIRSGAASALYCGVLLVILCVGWLSVSAAADDEDDDGPGMLKEPIVYEAFEESFEGRWVVSEKEEYKGVWKHSKSEGHEDYGLLVSQGARKYGISTQLAEAIDPNNNIELVLQYEVRLQNGLGCGGAYLKYLVEQGHGAQQLDNESPYSIMFGPDRCGFSTDKVHFIYRHKNPKSGQYVEHHLKHPPSTPSDKLSHVYTAILRPHDNQLTILIDGEERQRANLLSEEDFEPPLNPPIDDPEHEKPEDWDDRPRIRNPDAKKPRNWDEDAPFEIEDLEAEKPQGWLDEEPPEIDDPQATMPQEWDDEEDGPWEAPKIPNPKCSGAPGCGQWKRPTKRNPDYRGKWFPRSIANPNYMGTWKPRQIPNPDLYHLDKPHLEPIGGIGIEIWSMQHGILFDNILITRDLHLAEQIRETTWRPKFNIEKEKLAQSHQSLSNPDSDSKSDSPQP